VLCGSIPVKQHISALFAWLISHQPTVFFSHNKSATSNQPAVLFSQNKPATDISHQPTEQAEEARKCRGCEHRMLPSRVVDNRVREKTMRGRHW
jgi:hypothetical protein